MSVHGERMITRPVVVLATPQATLVGSDTGEWSRIGDQRITPLPQTGAFGAAVLDDDGTATIACWSNSVKQLRAGAADWVDVPLGATPIALAGTARGIVAGDATGGLAFVPVAGKIAIQDLSASEPIVELCVLGGAPDASLAILGAHGGLDVTRWPFGATEASPYRDAQQLVRVDTSSIGRTYAIYPGPRPGSAIACGRAGYAVLSGSALAYVVVEAVAIRAIVWFAHAERACVLTDAGDAWIVDASLARVARLLVPEGAIVGLATAGDRVLAWTCDGELFAVAPDGAARPALPGVRDVVLAAPDPVRHGDLIAVTWRPEAGVAAVRGRVAWS